ncbi:MAG: class I SAM-dependent RNA methyltransferase [Gemmatimonadales bacterium]
MIEAAAPVTVRAIAAGGDGVASLPDGRAVFIPRAAPGDRLQLRDVRRHARFARAEIAEVIEASPDRITPPCVHYIADRCGGCQVMHLNAAAQRASKARIVGDAIRRIAHLDIADPDVVPPPEAFGYRTKVTFTWQRGQLGYHRLHDAAAVFDVRECLIADPGVRELHAALREARRYLPRGPARIVLRIDRDRGAHLIVESPPGDAWTGARQLHAALRGQGMEAVVWWIPEGGQPRVLAGATASWPATVFEQVHPAMGRTVRQAAIEALGEVRGAATWDLYAGIGETTAELAARGAVVESVERDPRAVTLAERVGPAGPTRHAADVEMMVGTLAPPRLILTNPPRTGMAASVVEALRESGAVRLVYISCDPATLARDLARLGPAYQLHTLQAFDQFPQTAHVECVAALDRR